MNLQELIFDVSLYQEIKISENRELFDSIKQYAPDDVFVIGGAMMYRTMLPYCSEVLVTKVDADGEAEVFFENLDALPNWKMVEEGDPVQDNGYEIRFTVYQNSNVQSLR